MATIKRNKSNNSVVSSDIPMDIILQILPRLPVKSLIRFKLVCKTWYDLVENPDFIEEHRKTFTCKFLLVPYFRQLSKTAIHLLPLVGTFDIMDIFNHVDPTWKFHCKVLGICNGLVCLRTSNSCFDLELIICNPAIRHFCRISPSRLLTLKASGCGWEIFGFGIQDDSYKLVRIVKETGDYWKFDMRCELYTMCTNTWREIQLANVQICVDSYQCNGTHVNGVIYWKANYSCNGVVALFDLGKEVLDVIKAPSNAESYYSVWQLSEIKGQLALIIQLDHRSLEMWVLNETSKTWTMRYEIQNIPEFKTSFGCFSNIVEVLGCIRNDELLLKDQFWVRNLLSLDMNSGETKVILDGINIMGANDGYLYSESLVPVNKCHEALKLISTGDI